MTDYYPPAIAGVQWFGGGEPIAPDKVIIHCTEGPSWPSYDDGKNAPHMTAKYDFDERRLVWRQHIDLRKNARAMRNTTGGVETNRDGCIQVELVGTCDRDAIFGGMRMWNLPDPAIDSIADFLAWCHGMYGIPLRAPDKWPRYPSSPELDRDARMTYAEWRAFKGVCGHLHVPENTHLDPGDFPIVDILKRAGGEVALTEAQTVDAVVKGLQRDIAKNTNGPTPDVNTISVADGLRMTDQKLDDLKILVEGLGKTFVGLSNQLAALTELIAGTGSSAIVTQVVAELESLRVTVSK